MRSLARLGAVARKETREILRDPITLGIAIVLPLLMMFLFAYAITLDVRDIGVAVLDEDGSPESRDYVASVTLDELLEGRDGMTRYLESAAIPKAEALGVRVERVGVKDVVLPGEMKTLLNRGNLPERSQVLSYA